MNADENRNGIEIPVKRHIGFGAALRIVPDFSRFALDLIGVYRRSSAAQDL
jgi:hypothetical protein